VQRQLAAQALETLTQRLIKEHWDFYPTAGSRIGRHEYDGLLPDLSPASLRRRAEELRRGLAQLPGIDLNSLDQEGQLGYQLLELFLKRELFTLTELRPLENNPMRQVAYLNVGGYVRRDYAPLADRLRSATRVLQQVPELLETLDSALAENVGRPVLDMSIESYRGMARFYRVDLAQAVGDFDDRAILDPFNQSREAAAAALDRFVQRLEARQRTASDEFAIGPRLFSAMLATGEGVDLPLTALVAIGQASLESNLEELAAVASAISPGREVREVVAQISSRHPTADNLIPETRDMLEGLRRVLTDLDLITIPAEDRCQVMETPAYLRYAFAAMDSPGSLESKATEAFYYVTPVEPHWTAEQQEEWLANFNYDTLRMVSIHEVYPGHYVHFLHNRYGRPLNLVNRVATSYAFTEGWAHYAEQMMLETPLSSPLSKGGYRGVLGQSALRLTQLLEALVRNCRYLCSLGMHTQGMSVDEATRFFMDHAYMGELPARREALRGAFDPGYLNYTLGKLMILKLRGDYRREQGAAYSLKGFHDRLLSYGAPPLPLIRQVMLAQPGASPL
jgi:uncharacterized protein (DUF885 family)